MGTGILSRIFLGRRLQAYRWVGIFFVLCGLVIVGLCDVLNQNKGGNNSTSTITHDFEYYGAYTSPPSNNSANNQLLGDILIVCAQVIVATQMVYEEKFISKYDVPALQAVGWEGTFGFLTLATLLIPFYFIPVGDKFGDNPRHVLEDAYDGLFQLAHNWRLAMAFCGTVFSIAFFNFAGISVTKEMSATTRMVLDSVRTLVIWGVSLGVGWQKFQFLQLIGFLILVTGMCVYNDLLIVPCLRELSYRTGLVDRPGSYYDMQSNIEDELETSSDDAQTVENTSVSGTETTVFDPRHQHPESDGRQNIET